MFENEDYNYRKEIVFEHEGFINLRLGYYNEIKDIFHPSKYYNNDSDILLYVERDN